MKQYLVFDIGGTFIKYALMGADGSLLESGKTPSPMDCLDSLLDAVEGVGRQFAGRYEEVAVSMPGRIVTAAGIARTGGSFAYIHETPVGQLVGQRLGAPVWVANDGKCAANAEAWSGALADVSCGAVIVLGTGTGGGIVLDRRMADSRKFPAINIKKSGTRRDDLLLTKDELARLWLLRNAVSNMDDNDMSVFLIDKMRKTHNNKEFLSSMSTGASAGASFSSGSYLK